MTSPPLISLSHLLPLLSPTLPCFSYPNDISILPLSVPYFPSHTSNTSTLLPYTPQPSPTRSLLSPTLISTHLLSLLPQSLHHYPFSTHSPPCQFPLSNNTFPPSPSPLSSLPYPFLHIPSRQKSTTYGQTLHRNKGFCLGLWKPKNIWKNWKKWGVDHLTFEYTSNFKISGISEDFNKF